MAWLASPAAAEVTGEILHVARGDVAIMQQPAILAAYHSEDFWKLDELDRVIPALVETRKVQIESLAKEAEPRRL